MLSSKFIVFCVIEDMSNIELLALKKNESNYS